MLVPVTLYAFNGDRLVFRNIKECDWENIDLIVEEYYNGRNNN
ncbi:hypothetical protein [Caudoviricetes sp.]|nr:hypothetical protein [Caudoviricetes sp.]